MKSSNLFITALFSILTVLWAFVLASCHDDFPQMRVDISDGTSFNNNPGTDPDAGHDTAIDTEVEEDVPEPRACTEPTAHPLPQGTPLAVGMRLSQRGTPEQVFVRLADPDHTPVGILFSNTGDLPRVQKQPANLGGFMDVEQPVFAISTPEQNLFLEVLWHTGEGDAFSPLLYTFDLTDTSSHERVDYLFRTNPATQEPLDRQFLVSSNGEDVFAVRTTYFKGGCSNLSVLKLVEPQFGQPIFEEWPLPFSMCMAEIHLMRVLADELVIIGTSAGIERGGQDSWRGNGDVYNSLFAGIRISLSTKEATGIRFQENQNDGRGITPIQILRTKESWTTVWIDKYGDYRSTDEARYYTEDVVPARFQTNACVFMIPNGEEDLCGWVWEKTLTVNSSMLPGGFRKTIPLPIALNGEGPVLATTLNDTTILVGQDMEGNPHLVRIPCLSTYLVE